MQSEVRRGNSHRIFFFFFSLLELVVILVLKITFTCGFRKVDIVFNMTSAVMESVPMRVGCKNYLCSQ